jgi:sialic acid synthase SpsE
MPLEIAGRPIGRRHPVFVVAEIGLNHGGSLSRALELVDAAAWAGASAIKLQTIQAAQLVAPHCPPPAHVRAASMREFFEAFELGIDDHRLVMQRAREHGLAVLSTPFSLDAVQMLDWLGVDAYKIASGDLTYDSLIVRAAGTGRPLIVSTGMSELHEVHRALRVARDGGGNALAVLHCVSAYPPPAEAQNLRAIVTLAETTGVPAGLSDHGPGLVSAVAAVALGACIYERHLVLDDDIEAIDRDVSSTATEFRALVQAIAGAHLALGDGIKRCLPSERPNVGSSRRGVYAARPLRPGSRVTAEDVCILRPAAEVAPTELASLLGTKLTRNIAAGDPFTRADLLVAEHV